MIFCGSFFICSSDRWAGTAATVQELTETSKINQNKASRLSGRPTVYWFGYHHRNGEVQQWWSPALTLAFPLSFHQQEPDRRIWMHRDLAARRPRRGQSVQLWRRLRKGERRRRQIWLSGKKMWWVMTRPNNFSCFSSICYYLGPKRKNNRRITTQQSKRNWNDLSNSHTQKHVMPLSEFKWNAKPLQEALLCDGSFPRNALSRRVQQCRILCQGEIMNRSWDHLVIKWYNEYLIHRSNWMLLRKLKYFICCLKDLFQFL